MAVGAPAAKGDATVSSARQWPAAALVALTVVLTLESFRLVFPHLYGLKERSSLATVLLVFLAVAVSPLLAPLLGRILGARRAVTLSALLLGLWRLVAQFLHPVPLVVAIAGAAVALITLTLVLTCSLPLGARARGLSVLAGFGFDTALLGAFITWDPAWQDGIAAAVVGAGLAAALLACAAVVYRDGRADAAPASPAFSGGVALGALFALEFMFLANSAYLAAAAGIGLGWAILIVVAGAVGALALAGLLPTIGRAAGGVGALLLAAAGLVLPWATGPFALALLLAAQLGAGLVVARALAPGDRGPVRAGLGLALGWFVGLLAILLYQLHYDRPLPVDNRYVTALLGLVTLLVVVGRRPGTDRMPSRRLALSAAAALLVVGALVGAVLSGLAPEVAAESPDGTFRVVQWNIRQAVGEDGRVDPEVVGAAIEVVTIEAEGRAVIVLNEVARGWPLSGQLDLATWMSYRLGMHLVWGAAAGPQFGNLVLSRFPVAGSEVVALTKAGAYQGRSLVDAVLDLGGGRTISVLATHLQHRNDDEEHAVRLQEIDEVLAYWDGAPSTVLVGDLNPKQGDAEDGYPPRVPREFEEIARLLAAGFTTAGNLEACDPPTSNDNCSDYILAGPGLTETSFRVGESFGDHRMLVADVTGP